MMCNSWLEQDERKASLAALIRCRRICLSPDHDRSVWRLVLNTLLGRFTFTLIILTLMMSTCASAPPTPTLTPVVVQLRYTHQAQFAGLYAADQNGYFQAEGLSMHFLEGGPTVDMLAPVVNGMAQFGVYDADVLITARADIWVCRANSPAGSE